MVQLSTFCILIAALSLFIVEMDAQHTKQEREAKFIPGLFPAIIGDLFTKTPTANPDATTGTAPSPVDISKTVSSTAGSILSTNTDLPTSGPPVTDIDTTETDDMVKEVCFTYFGLVMCMNTQGGENLIFEISSPTHSMDTYIEKDQSHIHIEVKKKE